MGSFSTVLPVYIDSCGKPDYGNSRYTGQCELRSGMTLPAGTVDINVNANSAGTIIANATRTGYESGIATVNRNEWISSRKR